MAGLLEGMIFCANDGMPMVFIDGDYRCVAEFLDENIGGGVAVVSDILIGLTEGRSVATHRQQAQLSALRPGVAGGSDRQKVRQERSRIAARIPVSRRTFRS